MNLQDLAALSNWAYLVIAGVAGGDAVFPVLPGETAVILGGVLAQRGDLSVVAVMVAAALGAAAGDNISYQLGSIANRNGKSPQDIPGKMGKALGWAQAALEARGASVLLTGRFIPGGRTALTFGAGYVGYSRPKFVGSTLLAATVWALYATGIGYLGGQVFQDKWWAGLGLGLAISLAITGLIELARKVTGRGTSIADEHEELSEDHASDQ